MLATLGYSIAGGLQAGTSGLATLGYGIGEAASPLVVYCVGEGQVYTAGGTKGDVYTAGGVRGQVYTAGGVKGQVGCR